MKTYEQPEQETDNTDVRKKIFFCVNLEDEVNEQILHLEFTDEYRFALMGVFKGTNPTLTFGKYNIRQIEFDIKPFDNRPRLYIEKVSFVDFEVNEDNGLKNIAKFSVKVSLQKPEEEDRIFNDAEIIVRRNVILDMDFSSENKELNDFFIEQKKKADKFFNFGGHICKSRVAF